MRFIAAVGCVASLGALGCSGTSGSSTASSSGGSSLGGASGATSGSGGTTGGSGGTSAGSSGASSGGNSGGSSGGSSGSSVDAGPGLHMDMSFTGNAPRSGHWDVAPTTAYPDCPSLVGALTSPGAPLSFPTDAGPILPRLQLLHGAFDGGGDYSSLLDIHATVTVETPTDTFSDAFTMYGPTNCAVPTGPDATIVDDCTGPNTQTFVVNADLSGTFQFGDWENALSNDESGTMSWTCTQ